MKEKVSSATTPKTPATLTTAAKVVEAGGTPMHA
jgi:hypothetical protein